MGTDNIQLKPFLISSLPLLPTGDMEIDDMCDEDSDDHSTTEDDAKSGVSRQSKGKNGSSHGNSSSKPRR